MSEKKRSSSDNLDSVETKQVQHKGNRRQDSSALQNLRHADDAMLAELGYKSEFRREFSVSARLSRILTWT